MRARRGEREIWPPWEWEIIMIVHGSFEAHAGQGGSDQWKSSSGRCSMMFVDSKNVYGNPIYWRKISYSKIGLSQANFIVKFVFQYIELLYIFLESTNIIEHCPEHDFLWSESL